MTHLFSTISMGTPGCRGTHTDRRDEWRTPTTRDTHLHERYLDPFRSKVDGDHRGARLSARAEQADSHHQPRHDPHLSRSQQKLVLLILRTHSHTYTYHKLNRPHGLAQSDWTESARENPCPCEGKGQHPWFLSNAGALVN